MFWIITGAVVAVLGLVAWWTSGRSRPLTHSTERVESLNDSYARAIVQGRAVDGNNIGGMSG